MAAGRWADVGEVIATAIASPSVGPHRSSLWQLATVLALGRGDIEAAQYAFGRASDLLGTAAYRDQAQLPHVQVQVELAAAAGSRPPP